MAFFSEEQNIANTNWKRSIHLNSPWRKTKLAFVTIINWIHFPSPPPRISSLKERFSRPGGGTTYAVLPSAQKQWKKRREKEWVEQRDREQKRAAHLWPWSLGMKWTLKPQVRSPCPTPPPPTTKKNRKILSHWTIWWIPFQISFWILGSLMTKLKLKCIALLH